ncbi:BET1-like protein isoform X1 [Rousettus aegyptiacus]|uniref:BET1-like protein n=2 Tax=Rousettus aegyptiacus TaxID=9407 RepID=A0A7J8GVY7_ROUAE|nr:BET1-like protein isoform X1 [Rousettus aegyptiacus]KAF6464098.1 Bet1 golgi vesicular membrane trafficking protein like [Rousettus aegyptiacus]
MADWARAQSSGAVEEILDLENKRMTDSLASKVTRLKSLALDIDRDTEDQNRYLDGMESDFTSVTGLLTGSVKRFSTMARSGRDNRKLLCGMAVGLIVVFFILSYLLSKVQSQPGARLLLLPPSLWSAAPDACLPALPLLLCVPRPPDRPGLAAALQCPLSCWGRRPRLYPQGPVLCAPGLQRGLVSHSGRLTRLCVWGSAACSSTSEPPRSCLATAALSPLLICQSLSWRLGRCLPGYIAAACVSTWSPWAGHTPERKFHIPQLFLGP